MEGGWDGFYFGIDLNYDTYDVEEGLNEFYFGTNLKYGGLEVGGGWVGWKDWFDFLFFYVKFLVRL